MTATSKLRPKFGTHVTGGGFWPGQPSAAEMVARLQGGESVRIFDIRRIGKSSLLYEAARLLEAQQRQIIRLDGQKLHSIPSLLKEIISQLPLEKGPAHRLLEWSKKIGLPPELKSKLEALITEKIVGDSEPAIDAYAELLFKQLGIDIGSLPPSQRPVLFIDELPFFCDNVMAAASVVERDTAAARINNLLAVLRAWRGEEIGIAMAVCGSLSMAWLRRKHGIQSEHLNDCLPLWVEELSLPDAVAMTKALIAHENPPDWQDGVAERLCELLPSLFTGVIQFAFSFIRFRPQLTLDVLDCIYRDKIADGLQTNYYGQFDKRIGHYEKAERDGAYQIFAAIVASQQAAITWETAETLCGVSGRSLLERLTEDGFIRASRGAGIRFASGLALHWYRGPE